MQPTKRLVGPSDGPNHYPVPPYDTGKVKIGLYYTRPSNWSASRDSLLLQSALLSTPANRPSLLDRLITFFRSLA